MKMCVNWWKTHRFHFRDWRLRTNEKKAQKSKSFFKVQKCKLTQK